MKQKRILLFEGKDDIHVVLALFKAHQLPLKPRIRDGKHVTQEDESDSGGEKISIEFCDMNGIEKLIELLDIEIDREGLERLGIIVDADTDVQARWTALCAKLTASGYGKLPPVPDANGTIIHESKKPTIGIWIMPDNQLPGMLEHFVQFLVPPGDTLWAQAQKCLEECQEDHRFAKNDLIKAHMHTWLAWQKEPGRPMGTAITARYLDPRTDHAQLFVAWIEQLFLQ